MKCVAKDLASVPSKLQLLVAFAFAGGETLLPKGVKLSADFSASFKGEFRELKHTDAASGPCARVLLIGLGKQAEFDAERLRRVAALAVQRAEALEAARIAVWCPKAMSAAAGGARAGGTALAEGAWLGGYRFQEHKSKPKRGKLESVELYGDGADFAAGVERGLAYARANAFARDLQNQPANFMRPRDMAAAAQKLARGSSGVRCKVLGPDALAKLGMGALLGVAAGSAEPAQLIHLSYTPKGRARGRVALVGKGLTFDTGGISIKPAGKMWDMKYDMSGGAAVLGVFHALAELGCPFEVHGVVPASENMPDGKAVKPGDLVRAMNGTTIEVLNTDAEGRLILCDALSYVVEKVKPDAIVDLATLTGAVVMALGHEYTGVMTRSERLRDELLAAGEAVGEKLWPLPLADHHRDLMKGEVGDLKNIALGDPGAGASQGAAFLSYFVEGVEWAHLDIAGTAWGSMNRDYVGGSLGSGVGVRLLLRWLETRDG
jgi:leucyl aminopeptidase